MRSKKYGRGQTQKFFFFEFCGDEDDIKLNKVKDEDFSDFFWVDPVDIVNKAVDFRKPVYKKLIQYFQNKLSLK